MLFGIVISVIKVERADREDWRWKYDSAANLIIAKVGA